MQVNPARDYDRLTITAAGKGAAVSEDDRDRDDSRSDTHAGYSGDDIDSDTPTVLDAGLAEGRQVPPENPLPVLSAQPVDNPVPALQLITGPRVSGEIVEVPYAAWERMPGESDSAYAYFAAYRDMGRDRTVAKVADLMHRSRGYLHHLATDGRWVARARAYDGELDRLFAARATSARMELAERHAAIAREFLDKIRERLDTLDADRLSPLDVARWLDVATKMERMAWRDLAKPTSAADAGVDVSALDDAARTARLASLKAEVERRLADAQGTPVSA